MKKTARLKIVPKIIAFLLILACLYLVFVLGYTFGQKGKSIGIGPKNVVNTEVGKPNDIDFSLYWEAWNKMMQKSALNPDPKKMIYGSISGLLSSTGDPYTVFFSPEENKQFRDDIQGQFDGIGVELVSKDNLPTVVAPLSGSPAEVAGLKAGDIILEVDGTKTADLGFNDVINKIRGQKGTEVKLSVARANKDQPIEIRVTRDTIVVKSVEWKFERKDGKKYANVKIRQFGDDTDKLFDDFVNEAVKEKPDGIIVDLRNNPGGYLESAVTLASYFLDGGTVVIEKDKNDVGREYKVVKKARLKGFKTAVLVNEGSASASEIFAGALQDRKAGKLIGEKTFGKGSVQELVDLSDGSAVKITVAKWLTPNGRAINKEGIEPDITVLMPDDLKGDVQLDRAVQYIIKE